MKSRRSTASGEVTELRFRFEVLDRGLEASQAVSSCNPGYDFVVRTPERWVTIQVKGGLDRCDLDPRSHSRGSLLVTSRHSRFRGCDYLAVCHPDEKKWWIIPSHLVAGRLSVHLRVPGSSRHVSGTPRNTEFDQYYDNWAPLTSNTTPASPTTPASHTLQSSSLPE